MTRRSRVPIPHRLIRHAVCLLSLVFGALGASDAAAQTRLDGVVVDAHQQPVARAHVAAAGETGVRRSARADAAGAFRFDGLPEGRYDVSATAAGLFGEARGIVLARDTASSIAIVMAVRAVSETLVVSASQLDQPLSRVADAITVIDGVELEARQLHALGDALGQVPGFTVAASGGPGTLTSLFPRGGESDYTLVLVDGVRANAFGGGIDLSQVTLDDVERIEVIRGPQSAVHGSDAIGGVVQIITRQGGEPSAYARLEAGSRDTRRVAAGTTGEHGRWRWQAGADRVQDDGFTGTAPANGERVTNDDARAAQLRAGAGWRWTRGTDLQGTFRHVTTDRGAPGPYGSDPAGRFDGVDRIARGTTSRHSAAARVMHPWMGAASRVRQRVTLDVADYDLRFENAFGPSASETRRLDARTQSEAVLGSGWSVAGGAAWLSERARSTFITSGLAEVPVERRVIGTFGEARWDAVARLTLQAGVRAEHMTRAALPADPLAFPPRPLLPADTVVSVNPKLAGAWLLHGQPADGARAWTRVRGAAGTGIRPPDAFEIAFTDNPALKPERSRSVELGVTQALAGGAVHLEGTVFVNRYDDLIVSIGSLRDVSRYRSDNVSNARARGVELGGVWRAGAGVLLRASYTWLDTAILAVDGAPGEAPTPFEVGDPLLRRPRHQGAAGVSWDGGRAALFTDLRVRGVTLDAEPAFGPGGGLFENPGRAVVDAGGSFRLVRGVDLYARVLNVLNRGYEEVLGFPAPGRTAFVGARLAAGR